MTDMRSLLLAAFQKHNIASDLRAGIAALMGGESDFKPVAEVSYAHTGVERIREIFKTATAGLTDADINRLKANPETFFNQVYGHDAAPSLGNTSSGDGYKYRGRGLIQLTGRSNYDRYGNNPDSPHKVGVDLVADPDRENEPAIAVETAIVYMLDRYKGGGWEHMKAAVGNSFGNVDDRKNQLFAQYVKSKEWDAEPPAEVAATAAPAPQDGTESAPAAVPAPDTVTGAAAPSPAPGSGVSRPAVPMEPAAALRGIQRLMQAAGFYQGSVVDGDFRGKSITGIDALVRAAGQPGVIGQKGT
jgi:predicted chitinase